MSTTMSMHHATHYALYQYSCSIWAVMPNYPHLGFVVPHQWILHGNHFKGAQLRQSTILQPTFYKISSGFNQLCYCVNSRSVVTWLTAININNKNKFVHQFAIHPILLSIFIDFLCICDWHLKIKHYSSVSLPTDRLKLFWPCVRLCSWVDKLEPSNGLIPVTPCFTGQRLQYVLGTLSWKKAPPAQEI